MIWKLIVGTGAAVLAVALSAGSALAFECFNANRSAQGNAGATNGQALMSLSELLSDPEFVGLCPAGVEHVISGLEEEGFEADVVINFRALMAGGLEKNGKGEEKLHDGQGIDHLGEEFIEVADELIGEGFGVCAG